VPSRVRGVPQTQRALVALAARLSDETEDFLVREAQAVLDEALRRVPHESGDLARSGEVIKPGGRVGVGVTRGFLPRDTGGRFTKNGITVRFGNSFAADYALAVHETASEHDPPSWRGKKVQFKTGSAKFLERPFRERVGTVWARLEAHLRSKLAGR
jgi:hypothetical protein